VQGVALTTRHAPLAAPAATFTILALGTGMRDRTVPEFLHSARGNLYGEKDGREGNGTKPKHVVLHERNCREGEERGVS